MLRPALAPSLLCVSLIVASACAAPDGSEAGASGEDETAGSEDGTGETSGEAGDGDGDASGDGEGEPPVPAALPTPTAGCPSFETGNVVFSPAGIDPRTVKLWVPDEPASDGMLVIYWHAYGSAPDEAAFTLSTPVIEAITGAGGVVAAPYSADDSGEFPWFIVNGSDRDDDMLLGDEIVACAIEQLGVDPRRIHTTGMSAGGLQTTGFSMHRSRYLASAASFSGGAISILPFEDPDNRFAAMIIHGGDNDTFGGTVNFKTLSEIWLGQLEDNGNFAFVCDHGGGHNIPSGYGPSVVNFFYAHPFGTEPSPYAEGLPEGVPADCSL